MVDKTVIVEINYDTEAAVKNLNDLTSTIEGERVELSKLKWQLEAGLISQKEYSIAVEKSKDSSAKANAERKATIQLLSAEKGSINELKANIKLLTLERDKLNTNTVEGKAKAEQYTAKIKSMQEAIKGAGAESGKSSGLFAGFGDKLSAIPGPIGGIIQGFMGMTKAAWAFVSNPIGAIIAAIVLAVTALVAIFKSFAPVVDKVEQALAAVGAVLSTLKNGIIGWLTGAKSFNESFSDMGEAMAEAAKEAMALKKAEQDLEDQQYKLIASSAKYKRQQDELLLQAKDKTKSEEERIRLIDEALEIEKKAYAEKKDIADKEYEIALGKIIVGRNLTAAQKKDLRERGVDAALALQDTKDVSDEEVKAFAEAIANKENVYAESISIREKAINKKNALLEKEEEEAAKAAEKEKARLEKLAADREKAAEKEKARLEKLAADREKAIKNEQALLKYQLDLGELSSKEYYEKLEKFRDDHFAKTSEDYRSITLEIKKYNDDQIKAANEKAANDDRLATEAAIKRGEYIYQLSQIKAQELELENNTIEEKKAAQKRAADDELKNLLDKNEFIRQEAERATDQKRRLELEGQLLTNEQIQIAQENHHLKLLKAEQDFIAAKKAQEQKALDETLAGFNQIVAASQAMSDKRVSISQSALAKFSTINFAEIKDAKDGFMQIGTAAQGLTNLITANHDRELASMQSQKAQELALAEGNKELQDQINKKYAKKEEEIKRKQFEDDKKKAIVDATIAMLLGAVKALPNLILSGVALTLGGAGIASIALQKYEPTASYAKGGIIGGRSHAQGGTKFYGSDGSRFEAEKGEAMFVLKKDATAEIAALSAINESFGGRSWTSPASSHLAEGGQAVGNIDSSVNDALQRTPIFVRVSDIEIGLTEVSKVKQAGVI